MILVTGASGNVGRSVADQLLAAGEQVRGISRHALSSDFPNAMQIVQGDLSQPDTLANVFEDIEAMFLFTPSSGAGLVAETAYGHGVRRVVLLSSIVTQKADPKSNVIAARHWAAEQAVSDSGLSWTYLRPDTFAANALEWAPSIRKERTVRAPYGLSQRCPIHEQDIAAVAVRALTEAGHEQAAYWLTGPEAITVVDQVSAISEAIGEEIQFEELSRDAALESMAARMPRAAAERLMDYGAKSVDNPPPVSGTISTVLGREALSFVQWAKDHVSDFR